MTPEQSAWVERELRWGNLAMRAIAQRVEQLHADGGGLERFASRMAVVELTGAVAKWAHGLHEGLARSGSPQAASAFAAPPPFAATDTTRSDCEQLIAYVDARVQILREVLDAEQG